MLHRLLAVLFAITLLGTTAGKLQAQATAATCFGSDAGAASVDWSGHNAWAQQHSASDVESNLEWKVNSVFQCVTVSDRDLFEAFSELSVVIGQYVPSASCFGGDAGAASTDRAGHYAWASQRTRQMILANLLWKVQSAARCVNGARYSSYFADLSVILARYGGASSQSPAQIQTPMPARIPGEGCFDTNASDAAIVSECTSVIQSGITGSPLETAYYRRGTSYLSQGQVDRALADFDQAVSLDPRDENARANRGVAYNERGDYDKAIGELTQALSLDRNDKFAYNNRGNAFAHKGEYDEAIADYDHAISLDPNYVVALNNRGRTYLIKGEYDKAIADLNHAISLNPQYARAYANRGEAYDYKGEYDKAIADLNHALSLDPKFTFAYNDRGDVYRNRAQYAEAIADYTQAIALDASSESAYRNRAMAYLATARFDGAANDLTRAVNLAPTDAYAVLWLHIARMKAGARDGSELTANAAKLAPAAWPMPVVKLYLGKSTPEIVLAAATGAPQRCEAAFYVGEWRLAQRQTLPARKLFEQAVAVCPKDYVELWGARTELSRLGH